MRSVLPTLLVLALAAALLGLTWAWQAHPKSVWVTALGLCAGLLAIALGLALRASVRADQRRWRQLGRGTGGQPPRQRPG